VTKELNHVETSKWQSTSGRTVTKGLTFRAEIPILKASFGREASLEFTESEEVTMGKTTTKGVKFKLELQQAVANPGVKVFCKQSTQRYRISVPFTLTWSDRKKTEGVYTGSFFTESNVKCEHFTPVELNPEGNYDCHSWRKKIEEEEKKDRILSFLKLQAIQSALNPLGAITIG